MSIEFFAGIFEEVTSRPQRITIEAPENTQVELQELIALNNAFEITIVEGLIGEELLPMQFPIDIALFAKRPHFEVGTLTPESPLHLYVETFGSSPVPPYINFAIVGRCAEWTAPKTSDTRRKRVGELALYDLKQWLHEQALDPKHAAYVLKPIEAFLADRDLTFGDLEPNEALAAYLQARGITDKPVRAFGTNEAEAFRQSRALPIQTNLRTKRTP